MFFHTCMLTEMKTQHVHIIIYICDCLSPLSFSGGKDTSHNQLHRGSIGFQLKG